MVTESMNELMKACSTSARRSIFMFLVPRVIPRWFIAAVLASDTPRGGIPSMKHVHTGDRSCTKFELLIPQLKENRQKFCDSICIQDLNHKITFPVLN